ncbi:hypothetical protein F6R97_16875 [Pseudomonas sp. JV414]|nr:hypothetical protein [Pseudomonas sp. JV414]
MWRGGLPPFGCEAVVKSVYAVCLKECQGSAAHSNGGKPPRHRSVSPCTIARPIMPAFRSPFGTSEPA